MHNFKARLKTLEATRFMGLIDSYRRTLELTEIEERLQALENISTGYNVYTISISRLGVTLNKR